MNKWYSYLQLTITYHNYYTKSEEFQYDKNLYTKNQPSQCSHRYFWF